MELKPTFFSGDHTSFLTTILAISLFSMIFGCAPKRVIPARMQLPTGSEYFLRGLQLSKAEEIPGPLPADAKTILRLENGSILILADMDIDADGSPRAKSLDPLFGQLQTSLRYPGIDGQRQFIDSEAIPYFVLPLGFAEEHGLELGDIGVVIYMGRHSFAIYADNGPVGKIGEGSIQLARQLGYTPWVYWLDNETFSTHGAICETEVVYVVFPGTKPTELAPDTINETISRVGANSFQSQGGRIP
ncbi:MAG: hypothetical protein GY780_05210 [bacterium]|nr:hypothetical protein [bacterium]